MTARHGFHFKVSLLVCAAGTYAFGWVPIHADAPPTSTPPSVDVQQSAYRASIAQEEVKKQTELIRADIKQVIAQLKENDLGKDDIRMLNAISANLSHLSQEDMQKVINTLQSASINSQQQARQQNLVDAYQGQKDLSNKLKALSAQLSAEEGFNKIPEELQGLIVRQSANIRQTSTLSKTAPDKLTANQNALHAIVYSEQNSIGSEVDTLIGSLASFSSSPANDPETQIAKATYDATSHSMLQDAAHRATDLTKAGPFPDAVAKQKSVRDYLAGLLKAALAKQDALAQLNRAKAALEEVIADQKDLAQTSKDGKTDPPTLAQKQAEIGDRTEMTQDLIKPLNPPAADTVNQAEQKMDVIASDLEQTKDPAQTVPAQQDVVKALEEAEKQLDQQIAEAEAKQNESPADLQAELKKLLAEIKQDQQTAPTDPKDTAANLQKIHQDALDQNPDAADKLADAADKLTTPQPDLNTAQQDMADAIADLQKQEDANAQDAQDSQDMNNTEQALAEAQQDAGAADKALNDPATNNLAEAARELTAGEGLAEQVSQNGADLPGDAQQDVAQAADALKKGAIQTVQGNKKEADQDAQQAMQDLAKAQAALAKSMAALDQSALGKNMQSHHAAGAPAAPDAESSILAGGVAPAGGPAQVIGALSKKDRDAMTQYQAQKTPPEYTAQVQQYMKNLADFGSHN